MVSELLKKNKQQVRISAMGENKNWQNLKMMLPVNFSKTEIGNYFFSYYHLQHK